MARLPPPSDLPIEDESQHEDAPEKMLSFDDFADSIIEEAKTHTTQGIEAEPTIDISEHNLNDTPSATEDTPENILSFDNFADMILEEARINGHVLKTEPAQNTMELLEPDLNETPSTIEEVKVNRHDESSSVEEAVEQAIEPSKLAPSMPLRQVSSPPSIRLLLKDIFQRTLQYGLLPNVSAEPTTVGTNGGTPCWKVTISLDELGISASGHGSHRILAEVAASIQFDLMLSSPEASAKLEMFPRTDLTSEKAWEIIQSYCKIMSLPFAEIRKDVKRIAPDLYESRLFLGEKQLGEPAVTTVKALSSIISPLMLAHGIIKGRPDLWPAAPENPFQAKLVVGVVRMEKLQRFIKAAKYYLTMKPGRGSDTSSRGSYYRIHENEGQPLEENAFVHQLKGVKSILARLPFPPSMTRMLILAASIKCLEPAIILAALGKHGVYRQLAPGEEYSAGFMDTYTKNTVHGDHSDIILLFQRLRNMQKTPKTKDALVAGGAFDNFDPASIRSLSAAARDIERILRSASLVGYPEQEIHIQPLDIELQVRMEPYGGQLNTNSTKMGIVRHLMALGFGHNIAQYGYGTLAPGAEPELRVGSQTVHIGSPLRAPMNPRQLQKNLEKGPLVVLSGTSEHPDGHGLSAEYSSPISTWQAVLFGENLSLAEDSKVPALPGAAQFVINGWLPVLVKSDALGVSDYEIRDIVMEVRDVLHRAMRKATQDYVQHSWTSLELYDLLKGLPTEVIMNTRKQSTGLDKIVKLEEGDTIEGKKNDALAEDANVLPLDPKAVPEDDDFEFTES
ncbi:hypothetical protein VM1G_04976 [Cytospora mali]|uniref:Uncharacterized protein n=1 Tax=Cytospora mali TaxID=578113 RepID=A0A194VYV4_CYTMA|nr:hypothetical protein VM1G_04976 [Valsa mali]